MSVLKDKLANSVRQAKAAATPAEAQSRAAGPARSAAAPAPDSAPDSAPAPAPAIAPAIARQPAPTSPAVPAAEVPRGNRSSADMQIPLPSAKETFPRRVWPD